MKRICETYPHAMLSDIELKFCKGCGIYRSLDKFYMNCNPGNYCMDCKREQMARYNALYADLRRKAREEKAMADEERKRRVREYKRRWYLKKKKAKGETVRERETPPPPPAEPTPVEADLPIGARCKTCKSYSKTSPKDGWCMKTRRVVRGKGCCDSYREDKANAYQLEAIPIN